jgi:hypothetical protein
MVHQILYSQVHFSLSKIVMPQKNKKISSSRFIKSTAIMATTPEKQANQTGKLME